MSGGESGATRRRYLAALSGTVCAGGLAGCGIISAGEGSSSLTAREPICDGASSAAAALYDDWFVRLRPSEVGRPTLAFSSADLSVLERFSGVSALAEPYLLYPLRIARRSALADRPLQRVTALRAPGETRAAFVAFQWPGNELDRQAWLSEFKLGFGSAGGGEFHISFEEHDGKFGYERYNVADYPPARMVAYDDEHVLILPKADEAITADVETRFRRLVATRRDETRPYHCHHADARALVERLPPSDLVSARVWIDDGTLDSTTRAPDGARERGHCPLRLAESGGESTDVTPVDPVVDIRLSAVYREGAGGVGALSDYVRDHRMAVDPDRGGFRFVDPTFDRSGRVVTARERRSLARVVG